jgi:hypothetical protein
MSLALNPGVALYAGGNFGGYRGNPHGGRLIKVDLTTGDLDTNFNSGVDGPNGPVFALAINQAFSSLYVGGSFGSYRGNNGLENLLKVDLVTGAIDPSFTSGGGTSGPVYALSTANSDPWVYVGGDFTNYRNQFYGFLLRLNATNGSVDAGFHAHQGEGPNGPLIGVGATVYTVSRDPNHPAGPVMVGGSFKNYLNRFEMSGFCAISSNGLPVW